MKKTILGINVIAQIGNIVKDVKKISQAYADFSGVEKPPENWTGAMDEAEKKYNGKPSSL